MVRPTADSYQKKDPRAHVLLRPDMYIGSVEPTTVDDECVAEFIDDTHMRIVRRQITYVPGLERLIIECLTNSSDNVGRSKRAKVDPGIIEIIISDTTFAIKNGGLCIPIERHPEELDPDNPRQKIYIPKMIFGSLLTSSNYEGDRHEAGTNGIGAKAANIYSTEFMVVIIDSEHKLKYTQVWRDNMSICEPEIIEPTKEKKSSVQIVFSPDFKRFGQTAFTADDMLLYARHAADISVTSGVKVTFNGFVMNYDVREYGRLIYGDTVDSAILHYQWPKIDGLEIKKKPRGVQFCTDPNIIPEVVLLVVDTPDEGGHLSFVNCMMTRDGGVHVNAAIKAVADPAIKSINETVMKKLLRQNKGKELDAKTKRAHTISLTDVKPHISVLLMVRVVNPRFTSQTKTTLASPTPSIVIPTETLKIIEKWNLLERLNAALEAKQYSRNSKTDGKMRRNVKLENGVDANYAGHPQRSKCTLFITEGKSGAGYANTLVDIIPGGRDFTGVLPMKGKCLNVMNVNWDRINENAEITELKKMLGLVDSYGKSEIDTYYLDDKNFAKLRYGHVRLMVDSDVDGKHIAGLILNFFYCRARSLLKRGYISIYQTPTLKVWFGKTKKKFYTQAEYEEWKSVTPQHEKWECKYYKGLGTSSNEDIEEDHPTNRCITFIYDDDTTEYMNLAFNKKRADDRKEWQANWEPYIGDCLIREQTVSEFINRELILFSLDDTLRSIPKVTDSLKQGQRKIVFASTEKWLIKPGGTYKQLKVAQFSAITAEKAAYHHGEVGLAAVIVGMSQSFKCANNIPFYTADGQFGTYYQGGKDSANARYTHTRPTEFMAYIFRREDQPILTSIIEEGEKIEPESFAPIVPTVLINGAEGIGTGWSVYIPPYGVLEVIGWLKARLNGQPLPKLYPRYNRFGGKIEIIDRSVDSATKKRKTTTTTVVNGTAIDVVSSFDGDNKTTEPDQVVESTDTEVLNLEIRSDDDDEPMEVNTEVGTEVIDGNMEFLDAEEQESLNHKVSMVSYGDFTVDNSGKITVTELPIGVCPLKYRRQLEQWVEEKEIKEFMDRCKKENPKFEIVGFTKPPNHKTLKLRRCKGISNLVLLDRNDKPRKYDSVNQIIEDFFSFRWEMYEKRKAYQIDQIQKDITKMYHKINFIQSVIANKIKIIGTSKTTVYNILDKMGIPREIYDKCKGTNFSHEDIAMLEQKIKKKEDELNIMIQTPIDRIWYAELDQLEDVYRKAYGFKKAKLVVV